MHPLQGRYAAGAVFVCTLGQLEWEDQREVRMCMGGKNRLRATSSLEHWDSHGCLRTYRSQFYPSFPVSVPKVHCPTISFLMMCRRDLQDSAGLKISFKIFDDLFWLCWVFVVACELSCPEASGILAPGPGTEPVSPALQGRFLTTGPSGSVSRSVTSDSL